MVDPQPPAYAPAWLAPASVKEWLRINQIDTDDDQLVATCCAMAEPYVERCRPEFKIDTTVEATLRLDADYYSTQPVVRLDEWQAATGGDLADGRGHIVDLTSDPADSWGVLDPAGTVQVLYTSTAGTLDALPLADSVTGEPVRTRDAAGWLNKRTKLVLKQGPTAFTANTSIAGYLPDAEAYQGGVMYAAREFRRRNSPAGIETFGEVTSFVSRYDTDIERALHTGAWAPPTIA